MKTVSLWFMVTLMVLVLSIYFYFDGNDAMLIPAILFAILLAFWGGCIRYLYLKHKEND